MQKTGESMEPGTPRVWSIDSPDPETTRALAEQLGRSIGARGLAIGLVGPLGSGKTVFVKGLAEGLGVDPRVVSSPTFVIAQEYPVPEGPERLHHLDFYRLGSEAELESIGFLDLLGPGQVVAVEWLDRFPGALGPDRLEIVFLPADDPAQSARRRIRVTAWGDEATRVLQDWSERWARLAPAQTARAPSAAASARGDVKLLLALLASGWLALDGLVDDARAGEGFAGGAGWGSADGPAFCAALAPEAGDPVARFAAGHDALGPLRVRCLDEASASGEGGAPGLEGIARLLDGGRIDPNSAPRPLLESLPGIGPGRAAAIEAERARAPFRSLRDLERVPGIGPKTRAGLEPFLAVDSGETPG
ncbi:MAG: tRNA (adenosine(37)-N6)-threonylcarbamoyltransferase complex ATPase subunit type 1 TsaE [Myxococcota bacterium]